MENQSNEYYNKKIDIELRKKELKKKYGVSFGQSENLSPELENEWLNNIELFEQQFDKAEKTTVFEYIGRPAYRKADEIEPKKIRDALQNLMNDLNEHNMNLDTLCPVDDKELYRFITEELFFHEMDNMRVPGMMTCFIYEEFHPNAELDIRQAYDYFFRMTMRKMKNVGGEGYDLLYIDTENYTDLKGTKPGKERVVKSFNAFLDAFDYFKITANKIKNISINEDKTDARLTSEIAYKGCFKKSSEFVMYQGTGDFRFKPCIYGGWGIYYIDLPGLQI